MDVQFVSVAFPDIQEAVRQHLATLSARIDSFLEDHILESQHYRILIADDHTLIAELCKRLLETELKWSARWEMVAPLFGLQPS